MILNHFAVLLVVTSAYRSDSTDEKHIQDARSEAPQKEERSTAFLFNNFQIAFVVQSVRVHIILIDAPKSTLSAIRRILFQIEAFGDLNTLFGLGTAAPRQALSVETAAVASFNTLFGHDLVLKVIVRRANAMIVHFDTVFECVHRQVQEK